MDVSSNTFHTNAKRMRDEDEARDNDYAQGDGGGSSNAAAPASRRARSQRFSRAKTGCYTCRARRKKCDETRDSSNGSCQRCLKSGIECLGFPKMRGAPLAAHSKKQKAEERAGEDVVTTTVAAQRDGVSLAAMLLDHDSQLSEAEDVSLSDFVQLESPAPHNPSQRLSICSIPNSALSSGPGSPTNALGSLGDSLFSFAALASTRNASGLLSGIGSPLPSFSLDDWMPAGIERSATPTRLLAFPDVREEERAIKSLATFYGQFCWSWWIPRTRAAHTHRNPGGSGSSHSRRRSMQHIVHAIERRLRRSEIACTTVAAVAACYGFGNHITLNDEVSVDSFRQSWERIYEVVCDTKTSSLCAYLDWLGSSTTGSSVRPSSLLPTSSERQALSTNSVARRVAQEEWESSGLDKAGAGGPIEAQADRLFSFASKVLTRVALAAKQDQDVSTDMSSPLEYAALVHVDVYVQAAMDLALFAYACRPASVFYRELDAAGALLESLLGRGQSVRLSEIDGVEAAGFRTFAWADITNAVVSGRSTRLLYLFDDDRSGDASDKEDDGDALRQSSTVSHDRRHRRKKGVSISFGCPDDVLVIFAHIANLHFQLRHARATGAIKGNGPEALPAWAMHAAFDLNRRIEASERASSERTDTTDVRQHSRFDDAQRSLAVMWRHAAAIFLHTTAYRVGPLGKVNQLRMRAILDLWTTNDLQEDMISNGNPALPLLFAAFVAQQPEERQTCREALARIGQHEVSRTGYRSFVERMWKRTDEAGFGVLWHDLLDGHESCEIAIM